MNNMYILKIISGTWDDKRINSLCVSDDKDKLIERQSVYQKELDEIFANKPPLGCDEFYEWGEKMWKDISYSDLEDKNYFFITEIENL